MRTEKVVSVIVAVDGQVEIDLVGFKGNGCTDVLNKMADGDSPIVSRRKQEYYESEAEKAKVTA